MKFTLDDFFYLDPDEYDFENCPTRVEKPGSFHMQDVVAALMKTGGVYSEMVPLLGRRRSAIVNYVNTHLDVKQIRDDIMESKLDELEVGIFESALAGNDVDRRFLLTTLGKDRGFSSRTEQTGKDGGPIQTKSLSDMEMARRIAYLIKVSEDDTLSNLIDITPDSSETLEPAKETANE